MTPPLPHDPAVNSPGRPFRKRLPALLVVALFVVSGSFVASRFTGPSPIDTDIVSLLPESQDDPVVGAAIARANEVAANRVAFLIQGGTAALRQQAMAELSEGLVAAGLFRPSSEDVAAVWAWVFAHRDRLLCAADRSRLQQGQGAALAQEILAQWYSPFSVSNAGLLESDPLLLAPRFMACLAAATGQNSSLGSAAVLSGSITASVFRIDVQEALTGRIAAWQDSWSTQDLSLARAGAVFHASYGAAQARHEMTVIGSITIVVILALYLAVFRSARPPLLAVLLIGCCLVTGLAVTLLVFTKIHVMVMVFAAALIGMVVDYTTYFLLTGVGQPDVDGATRARSIRRPLTVGMATSVGAFASLLAAPIAAFQQIAVFGATGLVAAWLAALILLPLLEGRARGGGWLARNLQLWLDRLLGWTPRREVAWAAVAVTAALAATGWLYGGTLDNVRRLQAPSPQLVAEEQQIRSLTGFSPSTAFFLVRGSSREEATANEQRLIVQLAEASNSQASFAASLLDPTAQQMKADQALLREQLVGPQLAALQGVLGLPSTNPYATLDSLAAKPDAPSLVAALRGQTDFTYWSIVPLSADATLPDQSSADTAASAWSLVDPAERYSGLLKRYRGVATFGLVGAAVATGLVLLLVYRRLNALWIMLPTVLALILTPAIVALAGVPFSFFSAMGLLLVVGAGVDYGIFQWERPAAQGRWTRVGIALAAAMTCVSVGLLGLSSVLPIMSFGVTVALGIVLSLALSPLVRCGGGAPPADAVSREG